MSLARRFGPERVAAACARALALNAATYTSVKSILAQNLDRQPLPSVQLALVPPPPAHENLRGPNYYSSAGMASVGEILKTTPELLRGPAPDHAKQEA